jgi:hypothetical protein
MKKTTRKARSTRQTSTPPQSVTLPPIVAALAGFIEPDMDGPHPDFLTAWRHMPAIVEGYAAGEESSIDRVTRYSVLEEIIDATLARSRQGEERRFAELVDRLEAEHEDDITILTTPYAEAMFQIGFALACYLLTNPAPVTISQDGAR